MILHFFFALKVKVINALTVRCSTNTRSSHQTGRRSVLRARLWFGLCVFLLIPKQQLAFRGTTAFISSGTQYACNLLLCMTWHKQ